MIAFSASCATNNYNKTHNILYNLNVSFLITGIKADVPVSTSDLTRSAKVDGIHFGKLQISSRSHPPHGQRFLFLSVLPPTTLVRDSSSLAERQITRT